MHSFPHHQSCVAVQRHRFGATPFSTQQSRLSGLLIASSGETRLLLCLALGHCEPYVLAGIGGIGASVLLYVAAALESGCLIDEGVSVDREGSRRVTRFGDGRGSNAT